MAILNLTYFESIANLKYPNCKIDLISYMAKYESSEAYIQNKRIEHKNPPNGGLFYLK